MDALVRQAAPQSMKAAAPLRGARARQGLAQIAAAASKRDVDVALFRNLPGAGAPMVSPKADSTLGTMDPLSNILSKLETKAPFFAKLAVGVRFFTRVVGPAVWGASVFLNVQLLLKALKDKTISTASKVALSVGTALNAVGAVAAGISALPLKFAARFGLGHSALMSANKVSGIAGGIGGTLFNAINMIETLRNPDSKPGERFFAKLGFGVGLVGFLFGTIALTASLPFMAPVIASLPWLLPLATQLATIMGFVGFGAMIGQLFLGKNQWLSEKLQGSFLA